MFDAVDERLEASASLKASSKPCVELDLEGTTLVYEQKNINFILKKYTFKNVIY